MLFFDLSPRRKLFYQLGQVVQSTQSQTFVHADNGTVSKDKCLSRSPGSVCQLCCWGSKKLVFKFSPFTDNERKTWCLQYHNQVKFHKNLYNNAPTAMNNKSEKNIHHQGTNIVSHKPFCESMTLTDWSLNGNCCCCCYIRNWVDENSNPTDTANGTYAFNSSRVYSVYNFEAYYFRVSVAAVLISVIVSYIYIIRRTRRTANALPQEGYYDDINSPNSYRIVRLDAPQTDAEIELSVSPAVECDTTVGTQSLDIHLRRSDEYTSSVARPLLIPVQPRVTLRRNRRASASAPNPPSFVPANSDFSTSSVPNSPSRDFCKVSERKRAHSSPYFHLSNKSRKVAPNSPSRGPPRPATSGRGASTDESETPHDAGVGSTGVRRRRLSGRLPYNRSQELMELSHSATNTDCNLLPYPQIPEELGNYTTPVMEVRGSVIGSGTLVRGETVHLRTGNVLFNRHWFMGTFNVSSGFPYPISLGPYAPEYINRLQNLPRYYTGPSLSAQQRNRHRSLWFSVSSIRAAHFGTVPMPTVAFFESHFGVALSLNEVLFVYAVQGAIFYYFYSYNHFGIPFPVTFLCLGYFLPGALGWIVYRARAALRPVVNLLLQPILDVLFRMFMHVRFFFLRH